MALLVRRLGTGLLQREELVAQIDKGRAAAFAAKLEIEQSTVERQGLFDIIDLERHVVETNRGSFSCVDHGSLHRLRLTAHRSQLAFAKLVEPVGELLQLPLARQCSRPAPGRLLAAKAWQRSPSIHCGNRSEQAQIFRLRRKTASSEGCFECAISL